MRTSIAPCLHRVWGAQYSRVKCSLDAWQSPAADEPADLVLTGGKVFSVFTREWLEVDVAIADGFIAGLGRYDGRRKIDLNGAYVVPGFIDAHVHIESSKLMVDQFSRAVLPHGTTTVVADPHEIANVLGTDGVHWLLDACAHVPLDIFVMAPSCVPASPLESPRAVRHPGAEDHRPRPGRRQPFRDRPATRRLERSLRA